MTLQCIMGRWAALILSFTFVLERVGLSAVCGWAFGVRHPCYDAFGAWIGTELRCLVIMKTCGPLHGSWSPPTAAARRQCSHHLRWLRYITAHSLLHAQSSVPIWLLWILLCTFWTLIIARIEGEGGNQDWGGGGGGGPAGWGGFRKTLQVTELTGNKNSIYSASSLNPPRQTLSFNPLEWLLKLYY